jgi:hypothetical protein
MNEEKNEYRVVYRNGKKTPYTNKSHAEHIAYAPVNKNLVARIEKKRDYKMEARVEAKAQYNALQIRNERKKKKGLFGNFRL